jgi:hypothetical protein
MSSSESNSNSTAPSAAPHGSPPGSIRTVVFSLAALAALVWAMAPPRARFQPAPIQPQPPGCPQTFPDFIPSDATEIPGADLSSLAKARKNHALFRLNMEPCSCGCNTSIAACRTTHPACPMVKGLVEKIIAEETGAGTPEAGDRRQQTQAPSQR